MAIEPTVIDPAVSGWLSGTSPVTSASLLATPQVLNDSSLGSRKYVNPLAGYRDPVAVASVYQSANVPAYLTQAVQSLNDTQHQRAAEQEAYRQRLLDLFSGPNSYLVAPAIAASAVAPGRSVTIGGEAFQNPLVGQAQAAATNAATNTANVVSSQADTLQRSISAIDQQIKTAWGPGAEQKKGMLTTRKLDLERQLQALQSSPLAQGVSGWIAKQNV